MKNIFKLIVLGITTLFVSCSRSDTQVKNPKYQKRLQWLLRHNVSEISVSDTKKLDKVTYLDAREKQEYDISHIEDAIWVGYDNFEISNIPEIDTSQNIVIYCSVGYRSEKITNQLEDAGYKKVYNLYGGLFEWYNEGLPIVDNKKETTNKIHGFNENWSQWVNERKKGDAVW
ncbi:MAG: rhodanese-like domain-containing protein [Saprospiraceae bacterium]